MMEANRKCSVEDLMIPLLGLVQGSLNKRKKERALLFSSSIVLLKEQKGIQGSAPALLRESLPFLSRLYMASKDKQYLDVLNFQVDEMHKTLSEQMRVCILDGVNGRTVYSPSQAPCLNDAVGIEQHISQVNELLDLENDKPAAEVVIHGIGGSGKNSLADAVYASLKEKHRGWRNCKATLIQNQELDFKIEENKVEAYERVVNWLQCGHAFSGNEEESFNKSRILFAYEELQPSA